MNEPQITYRNLEHSAALDARIAELSRKLDEFHPKITRCHVVIDELDRHKHKGNLFEARIDLHVPGHEIATHAQHEDPYTAVTEAFDQMYRQLEEDIRIKRGEVKRHDESRGNEAQP
jgi:ribosomal subunit interface protein